MSKEKSKFLRRQVSWFLLRFFESIIRVMPLRFNYWLGSVFGWLMYFILFKQRKNTLESLKFAYPQDTPKKRKKIAKESFRFMAQSILEACYSSMHPDVLKGVRIEDIEHLDNALKKGKGVVALTAHLGNFALIVHKLVSLGYPACVIVRPMRDEKINDHVYKGIVNGAGVKTIYSYPRKKCIVDSIKALRNNEIIIILMDQNFGTGGVWVKFFNKLAATSIGPIIFALRTGASVVPMRIIRESVAKHCIKISEAVTLDIVDSKDESILLNAIKFTKIIEGWIKEVPQQWSWVHRRWKSRPSKDVQEQAFKVEAD